MSYSWTLVGFPDKLLPVECGRSKTPGQAAKPDLEGLDYFWNNNCSCSGAAFQHLGPTGEFPLGSNRNWLLAGKSYTFNLPSLRAFGVRNKIEGLNWNE